MDGLRFESKLLHGWRCPAQVTRLVTANSSLGRSLRGGNLHLEARKRHRMKMARNVLFCGENDSNRRISGEQSLWQWSENVEPCARRWENPSPKAECVPSVRVCVCVGSHGRRSCPCEEDERSLRGTIKALEHVVTCCSCVCVGSIGTILKRI